ncbi:MAG: hypothetical protein ABR973_01105 [Candidatus Acidiferrales bacterium]|jgi:hypothetical protein
MRRSIPLVLLILALPGAARAQSKPHPKPDADRLGMTCGQILKMTSAEWILSFNDKTHLTALDNPTGVLRAIAVYGKCYDARTDSLAAALARSAKGPNKAARADFAAFETALKDFAAKALADAAAPGDEQKKTYAALYEKQFRYEFYHEYEAKIPNAVRPSPAATKPSAPAATPPVRADWPPPADSARAAAAQEQARSDADPMTMAKNHFGKLLDALPDDKMHELHKAFGEVVGPYSISEEMRLAVYRYAIFLLESPSATPSAPPPF